MSTPPPPPDPPMKRIQNSTKSFEHITLPLFGSYCLHSKGMREGSVFTGVLLTGGGTPVPCSFTGLWCQVLCWGYPSPRFFPWSLVRGPLWGYPSSKWGVPHSQVGGTVAKTGIPAGTWVPPPPS